MAGLPISQVAAAALGCQGDSGQSVSAPQDAAAALAWLGTGENEEREPSPEETPSSQAGRLASAAEAAGELVKMHYCFAAIRRGLIWASMAE